MRAKASARSSISERFGSGVLRSRSIAVRRTALLPPLVAALSFAAAPPAQLSAQESTDGPVYRIDCSGAESTDAGPCRVDAATFVGRRVFNRHCASCHAEDGVGSSYAPDLGPRIRRMTWRQFSDALDYGYPGIESALPAWGDDRDVAFYYRELWTYLNARASGELPPGPVELLRD
jgi:mono/diheme cytochrome c family protein